MNINLDQAFIEVSASKFLRMERTAGTTLSCVSGSLWVTRDNCTRDFELLPGDSYIADGRQAITVCGFEPSVVRIFQPQPSQPKQPLLWQLKLHRGMSLLTHAFASLRSITH
jgi:hypothetical protein